MRRALRSVSEHIGALTCCKLLTSIETITTRSRLFVRQIPRIKSLLFMQGFPIKIFMMSANEYLACTMPTTDPLDPGELEQFYIRLA